VAAADPQDLAEQAGAFILSRMTAALRNRGRAQVILAGGGTPRLTYAVLAGGLAGAAGREHVSWFFGDERWVQADHPDSNEGMARAALLRPLLATEGAIHSWHAGVGDPVACAAAYARDVTRLMGSPDSSPDVLVLGMGADGHTASLFPGSSVRRPAGGSEPVAASLAGGAAAIEPAGARGWRLTLCPDILRTSRCVVFLVAGAEKAPAFTRATRGDAGTPAAWIRGAETVFFSTRDVVEAGGTRHA
jgi:6-phosphogluconolactonase